MADDLAAELDQTVLMIWEAMFSRPLQRTLHPDGESFAGLTGIVSLDGEFQGAVVVHCATALAARLTAELFETEGEPDVADVQDAVGELTNMIAGNIKSILPSPSSLGLPVVAIGRDYQLQVMGTDTAGEVHYESEGDRLRVCIVRQTS